MVRSFGQPGLFRLWRPIFATQCVECADLRVHTSHTKIGSGFFEVLVFERVHLNLHVKKILKSSMTSLIAFRSSKVFSYVATKLKTT